MIATTDKEITELRAAGALLSRVLAELAAQATEGMSAAMLDERAEALIREGGGLPAFLNYKPAGASYPYPATLCLSRNDEVVHGLPTEDKVLATGDVVTLDLGLSYHGYFVDSATTVCVGEGDAKAHKLLAGTREALSAAVKAAQVGGHIGDIGGAVEAVAKRYGLSVVEELGGHAVGKGVHERPFIANVGPAGEGEVLKAGMVLALEPILTEGKGAIRLSPDEWTYVTRDHSRAAHFEQTILLTPNGPDILTPFN